MRRLGLILRKPFSIIWCFLCFVDIFYYLGHSPLWPSGNCLLGDCQLHNIAQKCLACWASIFLLRAKGKALPNFLHCKTLHKFGNSSIYSYLPFLLEIITFRCTCSERNIWWDIYKFQIIMRTVVSFRNGTRGYGTFNSHKIYFALIT